VRERALRGALQGIIDALFIARDALAASSGGPEERCPECGKHLPWHKSSCSQLQPDHGPGEPSDEDGEKVEWRVTAVKGDQRFVYHGNLRESFAPVAAARARQEGLADVQIEAREIGPWLDETDTRGPVGESNG